MTDNMRALMDLAKTNAELSDAMKALESEEEQVVARLIALADAQGITLTEEDIASFAEEVSDDDLDEVSGGSLRQAYNDFKAISEGRRKLT